MPPPPPASIATTPATATTTSSITVAPTGADVLTRIVFVVAISANILTTATTILEVNYFMVCAALVPIARFRVLGCFSGEISHLRLGVFVGDALQHTLLLLRAA